VAGAAVVCEGSGTRPWLRSPVTVTVVARGARMRKVTRPSLSGVNYFSRSTTTISPDDDNYKLADRSLCLFTLILPGAEDKALQGGNLSADSGARPGRAAA